jgi:hypothetical protein
MSFFAAMGAFYEAAGYVGHVEPRFEEPTTT